jgi:hypothetical protein
LISDTDKQFFLENNQSDVAEISDISYPAYSMICEETKRLQKESHFSNVIQLPFLSKNLHHVQLNWKKKKKKRNKIIQKTFQSENIH